MEITQTVSLPELLFVVVAGVVLAFFAVPNYLDGLASYRWTRQQGHLNGEFESKKLLAFNAMRQDRGRMVQLSTFVVMGLIFMTQPSAGVTWRAWMLYGLLAFIGLSIGLACVRERSTRNAVLEEVRAKRERLMQQQVPSDGGYP